LAGRWLRGSGIGDSFGTFRASGASAIFSREQEPDPEKENPEMSLDGQPLRQEKTLGPSIQPDKGIEIDQIALRLQRSKAWYAQHGSQIVSACNDVLEIMRKNDCKMRSTFPFQSEDGPWWLDPPPTDDEVLLDGREFSLRSRAFGQGMRFLLWELKKRKLVFSEFK
jgi:hypothetical protein